MTRVRLGPALLLLLLVAGVSCTGAGQVRFDRESCFIDGQRAGLHRSPHRWLMLP
jgi:hypothetical protein